MYCYTVDGGNHCTCDGTGCESVNDLDDICENCNKYYSPGCIRCQERAAEYCGCGQTEGCVPEDEDVED